ncbi:MAG: hypothetical protein CM1200mP27_09390 [Chloroflexota bacterium]|nr:MAG: hypothetical protein CM1200mP27_09390 [Chloroflexota bacterium]
MPAFYSEGGYCAGPGIMAERGVYCLVTLGGDGTNRAAVVGSKDIPMVAYHWTTTYFPNPG